MDVTTLTICCWGVLGATGEVPFPSTCSSASDGGSTVPLVGVCASSSAARFGRRGTAIMVQPESEIQAPRGPRRPPAHHSRGSADRRRPCVARDPYLPAAPRRLARPAPAEDESPPADRARQQTGCL